MKKLLIATIITSAMACQNPEDKATPTGDTAGKYQENGVTNTPPGPTTPDTSRSQKMDASGVDTMKK